jgi:hypothetical protein
MVRVFHVALATLSMPGRIAAVSTPMSWPASSKQSKSVERSVMPSGHGTRTSACDTCIQVSQAAAINSLLWQMPY